MKRFLKRILFLIPLPLLIIAINYFEDPANLFNEKYELGIADYLVQGNNVTNVLNYNERLLQKLFIEKMSNCPTVIVLGSSRAMQINSKYFKKSNFINNGVSGTSLEDYLAIYYLYEKKGCKIQKVILGLDPWLLNDNNDQSRWKDLGNEYSIFIKKLLKNSVEITLELKLYQYKKFISLISPSYFKTSLRYLIKGIDRKYIPTKEMVNESFTKISDGSIYYDILYRNASRDAVEDEARRTIAANTIYSLDNFTHLSKHYGAIFSNFVEYLQKQNIVVEFFLCPYNPIVYEYFKNNSYYHIVLKTENYFMDYAISHKIKVFGSYDPAKYNFDSSNFFDFMHCNEKAIEKILISYNK